MSMFVVRRIMFSVAVPSYLFMCWRPSCLSIIVWLCPAYMSVSRFCVCSVYNVLSACTSVFKSCLLIVCMLSGLLVRLYDVLPVFAFVRGYAYLYGCLVSWSSSPFIESFYHSMSYHCLPFKTVPYGDCSALWHYHLITGPSRMINVYWCTNVILRR